MILEQLLLPITILHEASLHELVEILFYKFILNALRE